MQICLYLTPELIVSPLEENTKDGIIRELVLHLANQKNLPNPDGLMNAIMEREATGSTFLPSGIAIPHARVPEVNDIILTMGIAQDPVQDNGGQNGLQARVFCLFFSPVHDKEFGKHLKLLARISALFSDTDFIEEIGSLKGPMEIFETLQKRERELDEE
jgi:PTS system nitrogen regulatory IIA component